MRRSDILECGLLFLFVAVLMQFGAAKAEEPSSSSTWADVLATDISNQYADERYRTFDFWIGEWDVNWRKQRKGDFHHQKEGSWTHNRVFPALSGKALIEIAWDRDKPEEPSQRGLSIRYLDTNKNRWVMAQSWPGPGSMTWGMTDQLIGDVHHGRLSMYSIQRGKAPDGTPRVEHRRYNFSDIRPGVSLRWDGSNTADHGQTWHTWAISEMHRTGDLDPFGTAGAPFPDTRNQLLCDEEPFGAMDLLAGNWKGQQTFSNGTSVPARLSAGLVQDGCAVMALLRADDVSTLLVLAYSNYHERWFIYRLDDQPGTTHTYFTGPEAAEGAAFGEARSLVIQDEFTFFITPEGIENKQPLRRLAWEILQNERIVIREDTRETQDQEWQTASRLDLTRRPEGR